MKCLAEYRPSIKDYLDSVGLSLSVPERVHVPRRNNISKAQRILYEFIDIHPITTREITQRLELNEEKVKLDISEIRHSLGERAVVTLTDCHGVSRLATWS